MHKQQNTRQSLWKETGDNDKFCHVQTIDSQTQGEEWVLVATCNISTLFPPASLLKQSLITLWGVVVRLCGSRMILMTWVSWSSSGYTSSGAMMVPYSLNSGCSISSLSYMNSHLAIAIKLAVTNPVHMYVYTVKARTLLCTLSWLFDNSCPPPKTNTETERFTN